MVCRACSVPGARLADPEVFERKQVIKCKQFMSGGSGSRSAADYYTSHLSASAYYKSGVGLLQGATYEHMGLAKRECDEHTFRSIESNVHPESGARLTPQTNTKRKQRRLNRKTGEMEMIEVANRRSGMDLTLIVPKTLSLVFAGNPGEFADLIEREAVASK